MSIIDFEPVGAELFGGVGEFEKGYPGLSFKIQLAQGESLTLSSGEKSSELDGRVTVFPGTEEAEKGTLSYFPARNDEFYAFPPQFIVQTALPLNQFNELLSAAKLGRMPSTISVEIEGMDYDWQPDGSGKKWDNKALPRLAVSSMRFSVPLVVSHADDDSAQRGVTENGMPATRQQLDQLMDRLDKVSSETNKALKKILWALVIVGGFIVFAKW